MDEKRMDDTSGAKISGRYSQEFKSLVLTACNQTGVVIKAVAQKHGVPISLVHKWRSKAKSHAVVRTTEAQTTQTQTRQPSIGDFVALPMTGVKQATATTPARISPAPPVPPVPQHSHTVQPGTIRIDLTGTAVSASVHWPLSTSTQCAAWLRELLR